MVHTGEIRVLATGTNCYATFTYQVASQPLREIQILILISSILVQDKERVKIEVNKLVHIHVYINTHTQNVMLHFYNV